MSGIIPVKSWAVFDHGDGFTSTVFHYADGSWSGYPWSYWVKQYGDPVAIIPTGGVTKPKLTSSDPQPPIGSVVLDDEGHAWERVGAYWVCGATLEYVVWSLMTEPVTLLHQGDTA